MAAISSSEASSCALLGLPFVPIPESNYFHLSYESRKINRKAERGIP
jgi:hypothetical protein